MATDSAYRLRVGDPTMLDDLGIALSVAASINDAAQLIGLAGASSLWRIAADVPAVRELIRCYSRGRGRPKKEGV